MKGAEKHSKLDWNMLVIGQIVTMFGSALLRFVLSLYVLDLTGRADIFSVLYALSALPLLLSPVGGAIADRFNKRNLIVGIDVANGAVTLVFIILTLLGHHSVFAIGVVVILLGFGGAMASPTVMASVPLLVHEDTLEQANGVIQGVGSLSQIMAPVLGGMLYGILDLSALLVISCIAFFLASIMERFIRIPFVKRAQEKSIIPTILSDMKEGFSFAWKQSLIRKSVILAALLNLCMVPFFIVGVPVILRVTMESGDTLYGIGMALVEFGMILGAVTAGVFARKMKVQTLYRWFIVIAILMIPLAVALLPRVLGYGIYPSFALFFLFSLPILMILTATSIYILSHVQRETPGELLGKVMAIIMAVAQIAAPIGLVAYGLIFEGLSKTAYIPALIVCVVTLLIALLARSMLKNENTPSSTAREEST
jgi:MFS family permease